MEAFIELLGTVSEQMIRGAFKNGTKYIIFRAICKNTIDDDNIVFNCIVPENIPAYTYAEACNIGVGDLILARGKYQQKYIWEERKIVNRETMKEEIVKVQVCKNRVYVVTLNLIRKGTDVSDNNQIITSGNVKNTNNEREKVAVNPNDNPFGK